MGRSDEVPWSRVCSLVQLVRCSGSCSPLGPKDMSLERAVAALRGAGAETPADVAALGPDGLRAVGFSLVDSVRIMRAAETMVEAARPAPHGRGRLPSSVAQVLARAGEKGMMQAYYHRLHRWGRERWKLLCCRAYRSGCRLLQQSMRRNVMRRYWETWCRFRMRREWERDRLRHPLLLPLRPRVGVRVVRNPVRWSFGNQDGGPGRVCQRARPRRRPRPVP
eukprot:TRINITY_DN14654_c0_g1_i1.p2 TRINITY_DN14654_c0_g1~~TRINITY_DN14654_c0_g1_i1.p2  ORF type:complete len:222 (+),score=50.66 TRINITY_DN14654_c0_g1_i1:73-738(+)